MSAAPDGRRGELGRDAVRRLRGAQRRNGALQPRSRYCCTACLGQRLHCSCSGLRVGNAFTRRSRGRGSAPGGSLASFALQLPGGRPCRSSCVYTVAVSPAARAGGRRGRSRTKARRAVPVRRDPRAALHRPHKAHPQGRADDTATVALDRGRPPELLTGEVSSSWMTDRRERLAEPGWLPDHVTLASRC
jgi:hypothetical protein